MDQAHLISNMIVLFTQTVSYIRTDPDQNWK